MAATIAAAAIAVGTALAQAATAVGAGASAAAGAVGSALGIGGAGAGAAAGTELPAAVAAGLPSAAAGTGTVLAPVAGGAAGAGPGASAILSGAGMAPGGAALPAGTGSVLAPAGGMSGIVTPAATSAELGAPGGQSLLNGSMQSAAPPSMTGSGQTVGLGTTQPQGGFMQGIQNFGSKVADLGSEASDYATPQNMQMLQMLMNPLGGGKGPKKAPGTPVAPPTQSKPASPLIGAAQPQQQSQNATLQYLRSLGRMV